MPTTAKPFFQFIHTTKHVMLSSLVLGTSQVCRNIIG